MRECCEVRHDLAADQRGILRIVLWINAALAANAAVLFLLWRYRGDDLNMRSVWLCSRNDVAANLAVLAAAGWVATSGSAWPDIIVGLIIALLFVTSAVAVIRQARRRLGPVPV